MSKDVIKTLRPVVEEIIKSHQLHLYDFEFVKEDGTWFLRVSIEKEDGTMDFETAEMISNLVSSKLDELDPIDFPYVLDVCSPGVERPLKNKEDYINNINQYICVYLNEIDQQKKDMYIGDLIEVNDTNIVLYYKEKTRIKKISIDFNSIKKAHIAIKF